MTTTVKHLTAGQRNAIRYKIRATEQGVARKYGISVALVREVRAGAQPEHPARIAAMVRRHAHDFSADPTLSAIHRIESDGRKTGTVRRRDIEAAAVPAPKGQALHVEGGADLPHPLG